ncbi:hypothetical protein CRG98_006835 [Punica granatum]|uniref:Reverse transcriptase domain-containing protein n=1 Tax=Punica granatum TaxID=22663 RepID=A0A2I0KWP3_PUNGR|nr:hypothetical protein CRG98_006835 [Punica granatum]
MATSNQSDVVIDETRAKSKKQRESSRDPLSSFEGRMTKMEVVMADVQGKTEDASKGMEELRSDLEELQEGMQGALNTAVDELTKWDKTLEALVSAMRAEIDELRAELVQVRRTRVNGGGMGQFSARPDVPRPKEFKGTRVAKDVDNFIWKDEAVRVGMVSMYLVDVALLWWRRRCDDRSGNMVNTWEEFKAEFRQQFYPEYAEDEARVKLRRLEHKGELQEYVRQFTELMLQIPSLTDKEAFFQFMDGLKPWAKQGLRRRGVQDLHKAMSTAESLVEFRSSCKSDSKEKGKPKGRGDKEKSHRSDGGKTTKSTFKDKAGSTKPKGKDERMLKCFLCDGPHMARECPTKAKLAALVKADEEKEEETRLGSLRASNLFISEEGAKKLGFRVERTRGQLKTVNSEEGPTCDVAKDVDIRIGQWSGKVTVEVIPFDDYDFVIGMDFLDKIDALLVPFADCICVLDAKCQCVVMVKRSMGNGQKTLSAMQLKRGIQKGKVTYLVALKVDEDAGSEDDVPAEVAQVLNSFKDVMPTELPKKLPPKREVDHRIELKHNGSLRMCIDYRALNKLTVKNKYPIPLIADLFDQLGEAQWFSKLDLRSGYYQVRIAEGDEPKTTCVTRYGSYKFLVMPFGLTNALATFCTLMNKVLHPFLDRFVVVYLDDNVVYSQSLEDHVEHLRQVFEVLRENSLYVKREKCAFDKRKVPFLGHIVGGGRVRMDPSKMTSIMEWKSPTKKARAWEWTDECQAAFDRLKRVVTDEPVPVLPCYEKSFEVETDASDFAIGGVLMQDGHPIAFESRKLSDVERRYTIQEKEMTAVVHCLWTWRHYLLGSKFVVRTDNIATSYFQTQKKTRQSRKSPAGLLEPLPIPECPWESVSMDFIVNLPKSEGCQTLMVVVDRFSKYATFIQTKKDCPTEEAARLFMKHVVKYWGVSTTIDWATMIDATQFSYNLQRSESTGKSPFEIVTGQQPSTPSTVASGYKGNSPAAYKLAKNWQEEADMAQSCLNRAMKRMKKWADKKCRHVEYSVGDLVLRVGNVAYKVELPKKLKLHSVFHVSMLKPFQEDKEDPSRAESSRAPIGAKVAYDQDVEQILADRVVRKRWCKPKREYLIKWKG